MKYSKVASDAFGELQLNAGMLLTSFNPANGTISDSAIFAATSGGTTFSSGPNYTDFGEGIDNIPANTKQLKRLDHYEAHLSGTAKTVNADTVAILLGASETTLSSGVSKIVPLNDLSTESFSDIWWVGDYSDKNGATNGGFLAIHIIDALNTGGFKLKSNDKGKGDFDFDFLAHYDLDDIDNVPFEIYVKAGTAEPSAKLSALTIASATLSPAFDADKVSYTTTVTSASSVVTATAAESGATVVIKNGSTTVNSGSAASWSAGENTLTVTVTNGTVEKVYTVIVTKS